MLNILILLIIGLTSISYFFIDELENKLKRTNFPINLYKMNIVTDDVIFNITFIYW